MMIGSGMRISLSAEQTTTISEAQDLRQ